MISLLSFAFGFLLGCLFFIYLLKRYAIQDFLRAIALLSDLSYANHPLVLEIRYLFHSQLAYLTFSNSWAFEQWEESIKKTPGWDVANFLSAFIRNERFRKDIINVLSYEKDILAKRELQAIKDRERRKWEEYEAQRKELYTTLYGEYDDLYVAREYNEN